MKAHLRYNWLVTMCGLNNTFYETTDNPKEVDCKTCLKALKAKEKDNEQ